MLTIEQFNGILNNYTVQNSFSHFSKEVEPPFIAWLTRSENFVADNKVHHTSCDFIVELYTTRSQTFNEELKLESYFNYHNLIWEKDSQIWIDEEKLMLTSYTVYG